MQLHAVAHVTASGTTTLIAAPPTGTRITILGLHLSVGATGGVVTLSFSATNQRLYNITSQTVEQSLMRWEGDGATALSLTAPATGPTDVTVDYTLEDSPS